MKSLLLNRVFLAAAFAGGLAGCNGGGSQPPPPPQSLNAQAAHRSSLFADTVQPSSSMRSTLSVSTACTPVATSRGAMTAAVVPTGAIRHATINASGCDIGVYLAPSSNGQVIDQTSIHDANQMGVFADQAQNVSIDHTQIYKIGNHDATGAFAPNGVQTGIGLYFRGASGSVDHTDIYQYQKNGTAFNCLWNADFSVCLKPSRVSMQHSSATGLGQVNYIAQNGIQYWDSTAPTFEHNTVSNNMYYNPPDPVYNQSATGYLFLCTNVTSEQQLRNQHNAANANDINYYVTNDPAQC